MGAQILRMTQLTQAEPALVLFSGGQDSTTCLAWALARFAAVETIGFDYGQRHRVELDCRVGIAGRLDGEPFVEVVEVLGVLSSTKRTQWAAELVTPASSPTVWDIRSLDAGVPVGPGNGICFFYRASFC